jgi:Zn finger protein HypA/HybF involved in hydrogenase expression
MNYELKQAFKESKLTINCANCNALWMVGDRERTDEEKKSWLCPNCISRNRADEAKVDELAQEPDFDLERKGRMELDADEVYDAMKENPHCQKCGDEVAGDEDGLCVRCK